MKTKTRKGKKNEFDDYLTTSLKDDPELLAYFMEEINELELSSQLKLLRQFRGLTQLMLAKKTKSAQPLIARMEKGETDLRASTIERIDKALGLKHVPVPLELLAQWSTTVTRAHGDVFFGRTAGK